MRSQPSCSCAIKLPSIWVPIAVVICAFNALLIVVGASSPELSGYGGTKELVIGIGVLLISVLLYAYRRVIQDRAPITLRENVPATPDAVEGVAAPEPGAAGT